MLQANLDEMREMAEELFSDDFVIMNPASSTGIANALSDNAGGVILDSPGAVNGWVDGDTGKCRVHRLQRSMGVAEQQFEAVTIAKDIVTISVPFDTNVDDTSRVRVTSRDGVTRIYDAIHIEPNSDMLSLKINAEEIR